MRVEIEKMVWWRKELGDGGSGGDGVVALAAGVIVVVTVAAVVVGEGLNLNRAITSRKNELKEPLIVFYLLSFNCSSCS